MVASDRTRWFALALLCAVQFMVVLDVAIVNVALPSIQTDLGFSQENLQWVISAYALVFGGFLLLGGRLADILGRRGVFMGGLVVFSIGPGAPRVGRGHDHPLGALDPDHDLQ
jgi:MFS family permease